MQVLNWASAVGASGSGSAARGGSAPVSAGVGGRTASPGAGGGGVGGVGHSASEPTGKGGRPHAAWWELAAAQRQRWPKALAHLDVGQNERAVPRVGEHAERGCLPLLGRAWVARRLRAAAGKARPVSTLSPPAASKPQHTATGARPKGLASGAPAESCAAALPSAGRWPRPRFGRET
eukprot:scaffold4124_cov109-Isochrysis_galbana.AAC.9